MKRPHQLFGYHVHLTSQQRCRNHQFALAKRVTHAPSLDGVTRRSGGGEFPAAAGGGSGGFCAAASKTAGQAPTTTRPNVFPVERSRAEIDFPPFVTRAAANVVGERVPAFRIIRTLQKQPGQERPCLLFFSSSSASFAGS
ncbi:hypothetical protein HPB50_022728 [Hyalomma asiaticum]|uniref:Uncharacterized protein n=1 Tax=Hyalomma asiaticum TaxID=266040 RepID=A0ACB7SEP9_HYAAI|nr:hypothetical protein HPB50_022728 [Hyalomma asiaticum]